MTTHSTIKTAPYVFGALEEKWRSVWPAADLYRTGDDPDKPNIYIPVSYTHLDVYKRQAQGELMYFLDVMPGVNAWEFSARLSARVTPDADGEHHFSLASAGLSRLFVDDALLVDNWTNWQKGDTYFGFGSNAVAGAIDLQAGRATNVRVEYAYTGAGGLGMKALRIGLARPLGDEALESAVLAAAQADVAVLFVGLTGEWDSEGNDLSLIHI